MVYQSEYKLYHPEGVKQGFFGKQGSLERAFGNSIKKAEPFGGKWVTYIAGSLAKKYALPFYWYLEINTPIEMKIRSLSWHYCHEHVHNYQLHR